MLNWKKIMGTSVLSASLVVSSFAPFFSKVDKVEAKSNTVLHTHDDSQLPFMTKHASGPFDIGMVNKEKLLASLIEQGTIDPSASKEEQENQLNAYLKVRADKAKSMEEDPKEVRSEIQKQAGLDSVAAGTPKDSKQEKVAANAKAPASIEEEEWNGDVITDEVLVLLIDFPDNPHSSITEEDNPVLLYDDYTKEHYEDMVFGDSTYKGGDGEDLITMKAFYEQQSGGSYSIDGVVSDWYTAKHPAAYYGGNYPTADGSDIRPRDLVKEALEDAANDPNIDLSRFDQEDLYDLDGDGNYREPDGIIDHLMIVHAGTGEEAGGGRVGADAIWSHSWSLASPSVIPGTEGEAEVPYWDGGGLAAYDYTIQPEDGATGVFAHEFGHDLGLPDEYDTNYTAGGVGAPTDYWSIMSSGSWAGLINGTEPTGFSPHNKEFLQNKWPNSNWFKDVEYSLEDIMNGTKTLNLDQASVKGTNADGVKVTLPDKVTQINTPASGEYEYFSGSGNDLDNDLITTIDLSGAESAEFTFKANYNIETDWDYASVQVNDGTGWVTIPGVDDSGKAITTTYNPYEQNPGNGITGNSNGWIQARFSLADYVGKEVQLKINYWTDVAAVLPGMYVDDLTIEVDGEAVVFDDAESDTSAFKTEGFTKSDGTVTSEHYYLIEWRNWAAADTALGRITRGNAIMTLDPGMVVWYVDNKYSDNWVGDHPGDGFLGVVDAHQASAKRSDTGDTVFSTRYQIQDAAFSLNPTDSMNLGMGLYNITLDSQPAVPTFNDYLDYSNPDLIYAGRNVPKYGLSFSVISQSEDNTVAQIQLSYDDHEPKVEVNGLQEVYSSNEGFNTLDLSILSDDEALGREITVKANVLNEKNETVVSAEEKYTSDLEEKELDFKLTLPEELPSGDYTLEITVATPDEVRATSTKTFKVDNNAPIPDLGENNGSEEVTNNVSVTVSVPDAKEDTLEYLWSTSKDITNGDILEAKGMQRSVTELDAWKPFNNGDTLTLTGHSGTYYLHVRGQDLLGNKMNWTSNAFNVDTDVPSITLNGENPLVLQAGTEYVEPGFTATDNVDGNLTDSVEVEDLDSVDVNKPGEYILTYTVTDKAGNTAEVQRTIHVVDEEKPYITLTDGTVEVEAGAEYVDPGFVASDNVDGDLTEEVQVTGEIDVTVPGEYVLTYTVTDSSNNSYSVTRIVTVVDTTAPTLILDGEENVVLEAGSEYEEPGYTVTDIVDGDLIEFVEVYGYIDTTTTGEYQLYYIVVDSSGNEAVVVRTITVQDTTAPTLTLSGEETITLESGQAYLEPGFIATDIVDGNISDKVVVTGDLRFAVGTYTIKYTVTDAAGNETTTNRTIIVKDTTAPELTLKGSYSITLLKGEEYKEPGYVAKDNVDGELTNNVTVSGVVDTNKVGGYTLTYTAVDSSGNKTSVERTVVVNELPVTNEESNQGTGSPGNNESSSNTGNKGSASNTGEINTEKTATKTTNANSSSGSKLPNTATSTYNWILAGTIIIIIGISVVIIQRRKRA